MLTNLIESAATFKRCTSEKLAFILLNALDLALTLTAVSLGAQEINPWVRGMLDTPYQLYAVKLFIPAFLAWLVPGKFLWPAIALLILVAGWDIKELVFLLVN